MEVMHQPIPYACYPTACSKFSLFRYHCLSHYQFQFSTRSRFSSEKSTSQEFTLTGLCTISFSKSAATMRQVKIVLMGSGGVGKTSLTTQFVREIFEHRYEPTIEEVHRKTIEIDGEMCSLELLDTAGIEQFAQMRDDHIAEGHGFILVYSVADKTTYEDAQMIREEIARVKSENFPLILVGNKRDLSHLRDVATKEGEALASRWSNCTFLETSAKCIQDANEIFTKAARETIRFEERLKNKKCKTRKLSFKARKRNGQCRIM